MTHADTNTPCDNPQAQGTPGSTQKRLVNPGPSWTGFLLITKKIFLKHIWRGCLGHPSPVNQLFAKQCRCCIPLFRMLTRKNCEHFFFQLEANPVQGVFESGCLTVSVENRQGLFASTCLLKLHIPSGICSYVQFESSMRAVLQGTKFTTV